MSEKRFRYLVTLSMVLTIVLAFLGNYFNNISLIFDVLVIFVSLAAGYWTNAYFSHKDDLENQKKYATLGLRVSVDIYDSLGELLGNIEHRKSHIENSKLSKADYIWILDHISSNLKLLQRFSLSANNNWKEFLPPEQLKELSKRENVIELSSENSITITEKTYGFE